MTAFRITPDKAAVEIKRWLEELGAWQGALFETPDEHETKGHFLRYPNAILCLCLDCDDWGHSPIDRVRTRRNDWFRMLGTLGLEGLDHGCWWYFLYGPEE